MITILEDYVERLSALHQDFKQLIAGLPTAALDWSPGPEMNSITVLIVHTAGAERYWIGDVAGQEPSNRDRPAEFQSHNLDEAALTAHLDQVLDDNRQILARMTLEDLSASCLSPRHNTHYTGMYALLHALDHTATHLGHIQMTRQLWEAAHRPR